MKPASEEEVREALYDVVDPELGIDVVNLGLIYGIHVDDANIATLDMTLTSAACPLTDVIEDQAKSATDGIVNELRSTGSGCRRGARTRSPTTAASSCGRSASTSEPRVLTREAPGAGAPGPRACAAPGGSRADRTVKGASGPALHQAERGVRPGTGRCSRTGRGGAGSPCGADSGRGSSPTPA